MKIFAATENAGKLRELRGLLEPLGFEISSPSEVGITLSVEENGATFEENAEIKARHAFSLLNQPVIADDSGLSVDALDGRPGVFSHRYAGENATDTDRVNKLLSELHDVPDNLRTARFVCAICYIDADKTLLLRGECEGVIGHEPRGDNGFGYDPVFMIKDRSFAEISADEKNAISHRAVALKKLCNALRGDKNEA